MFFFYVSLPENLGVVAALQRCPTPRLLAGVRLRELEYRTYLLVFSIFFLKPLKNIPTEGINNDNRPDRISTAPYGRNFRVAEIWSLFHTL